MSRDPTARLFVAIRFPEALRARILEAAAPLRHLDAIRWVRVEQVHITLRFMASVAETRVPPLAAALAGAVADAPAFALELGGAGAFPSPRRARVVWIGVARTPALERLHAAVETALAEQGIGPEGRPFHPHVTLGRVRGRRPPAGLEGAIGSVEFAARHHVEQVSLMRSRLGPAGAVHSEVAACPLAPPHADP